MAKRVTFEKYKALVAKGVWTENEIIYFRKALGYCGNFDDSEKGYLLAEFGTKEHDITDVQSVKGILFLKNLAFKANGEPRKTKDYPFGEFELNVIRNFSHFKFVALAPALNGLGETMGYEACYRVYADSGASFDYVAHHWGGVVVTRIERAFTQLRVV